MDRNIKIAADRWYLFLAGIFIASLVSCNLIFQKFFYWTPFGIYTFQISVGILPYPITFLVTDIISEIYGRKKADQVVMAGLVSSVFVMGIVILAAVVPATSWSPVPNETFEKVFGMTGLSVGSSMIAYLFAQFIDIRLFHFWKRLTKGKHLWVRNNFSTLFSQLADTLTILLLLCGFGAIAWDRFQSLFINGFLFKAIVALLDTGPFYACVWFFRRKFALAEGQELSE
ncbi:MAG: queuosine precursor transporter [Flavobacteriales bacterium]|nr:queuosine precursor transporter [Flavobacteriales bacterium]MCB9449090.1 queuosine precursor transporter [Flavobacteriales bacterium]